MSPRGVVYVIWGSDPAYRQLLKRSQASVAKHYPDLPMKVFEGDPAAGLLNKPRYLAQSPFTTTLFLDTDTVVLGDLAFAFAQAEKWGVACCINECPWLRRYGPEHQDLQEYNTGVLFVGSKGQGIITEWAAQSQLPQPASTFGWGNEINRFESDDQFGFSHTLARQQINPWVLPLNYNLRPGFHTRFFSPIKVWHSPLAVPPLMEVFGRESERGERPVTFCSLRNES